MPPGRPSCRLRGRRAAGPGSRWPRRSRRRSRPPARPGRAARRLQPPEGHAGGEEDGMSRHRRLIIETELPVPPLHRQALDVAGGQNLHAEALGLGHGPLGEVASAQAFGEPGVVLDLGAVPRLTAGNLLLDHDGADPFRGGIHRGGQSRRPAADDEQVVERLVRARYPAQSARRGPVLPAGPAGCRRAGSRSGGFPPVPRFAQVARRPPGPARCRASGSLPGSGPERP